MKAICTKCQVERNSTFKVLPNPYICSYCKEKMLKVVDRTAKKVKVVSKEKKTWGACFSCGRKKDVQRWLLCEGTIWCLSCAKALDISEFTLLRRGARPLDVVVKEATVTTTDSLPVVKEATVSVEPIHLMDVPVGVKEETKPVENVPVSSEEKIVVTQEEVVDKVTEI